MINRVCRWILHLTTTDIALLVVICGQFAWIFVGQKTRLDPYPFPFLLTVSNIVQLIAIFVIANAQKTRHDTHDERLDAHFEMVDAHHTAVRDHLDTQGRHLIAIRNNLKQDKAEDQG